MLPTQNSHLQFSLKAWWFCKAQLPSLKGGEVPTPQDTWLSRGRVAVTEHRQVTQRSPWKEAVEVTQGRANPLLWSKRFCKITESLPPTTPCNSPAIPRVGTASLWLQSPQVHQAACTETNS